MVGWVCSFISDSPQNVCLIRQFASQGFVGRKEGLRGGELAHPQAWGQVLFGGDPEDGLADFPGLVLCQCDLKVGS